MTNEQPEQVQQAKFILEVTAGLIPGRPDDAYTKRWAITGQEWADHPEPSHLLAEFNGKAQGYAGLLMLQPDYINWVRTDWVLL
jgi:hypothetical protein